MNIISTYALPAVILVCAALFVFRKDDLLEPYTLGARSGISAYISLLPGLVLLLCSIKMLLASGAVEIITGLLSPVLGALGIPEGLFPLVILRPLSGSASSAMLMDIFSRLGADSLEGRSASILAGSTDTIFYTVGVYFAAAKARSYRHALPSALAAYFFAVLCSCAAARLLF